MVWHNVIPTQPKLPMRLKPTFDISKSRSFRLHQEMQTCTFSQKKHESAFFPSQKISSLERCALSFWEDRSLLYTKASTQHPSKPQYGTLRRMNSTKLRVWARPQACSSPSNKWTSFYLRWGSSVL